MAMERWALEILLGAAAIGWANLCLRLYRWARDAAWLAGSTVASCFLFLGLAALLTPLVDGAVWLLPLWLAIGVLLASHLRAALRESRETFQESTSSGADFAI